MDNNNMYYGISKFFEDNKDTVFTYFIYRKMYTPQEIEAKYSDESFYEDCAHQAKITKAYILPDNDILLELDESYDGEDSSQYVYAKLSEVRLFKN